MKNDLKFIYKRMRFIIIKKLNKNLRRITIIERELKLFIRISIIVKYLYVKLTFVLKRVKKKK